jgi:hypothetical protein
MAIYRVGCGHCGDNNIHEASSDEESLQKHNDSKTHIALSTDWDNHLNSVTQNRERK